MRTDRHEVGEMKLEVDAQTVMKTKMETLQPTPWRSNVHSTLSLQDNRR